MRRQLLAALLPTLLLAACASRDDPSLNKHISQSGTLKVHPGLRGQPVPAELQETPGAPAQPPASAN